MGEPEPVEAEEVAENIGRFFYDAGDRIQHAFYNYADRFAERRSKIVGGALSFLENRISEDDRTPLATVTGLSSLFGLPAGGSRARTNGVVLSPALPVPGRWLPPTDKRTGARRITPVRYKGQREYAAGAAAIHPAWRHFPVTERHSRQALFLAYRRGHRQSLLQ